MEDSKFSKDDQFAAAVTIGINAILLIFAFWYTIDLNKNIRPSYIEIEFGEYQTGTLAEFSEEKNEEVATRPNPSEVETETPKEEVPKPEEVPTQTTDETVKPVDLPDEVEEVDEEPVKTPETDKVDPNTEVSDVKEEEVEIPPQTEQDETVQEGAESSGDEEGNEGELNADQGTGNDEEKSAPFELKWEGDIERAPMVQPLPSNNANVEATITIRFEVRPDGTVGRVIPLRKMSPELEREVMRTLRNWRFSRLPGGVPQQSQWGTITFRFIFD